LVAHNPEVNWETREAKIIRCPPLYGRAKLKEEKRKKKRKRVVTLKEKKIVRWVIDNKKNWGREDKIKENHRKIKEIVPKKFCYESPKKELTSHTFEYLIYNLKSYNGSRYK